MKKLLKTLSASLLCLVLMFSFAGCSGESEKDIDLDKLSQELLTEVEFKDKLAQIDEAMIAKVYGIDYAEKAIVYVSSGATAEEIALFKLKNSEDAQKAYDAVNKRLDYQKKSFELYIPEEMIKLDDAVIQLCGDYVIFCVSDGDTAKTIIEEYTK